MSISLDLIKTTIADKCTEGANRVLEILVGLLIHIVMSLMVIMVRVLLTTMSMKSDFQQIFP